MKDTLLKYKQLWFIFFIWVLAGVLYQPLAYAVVFISAVLFIVKDKQIELFIGFLFILLLSDYRVDIGPNPLEFAKIFKSVYFLLLLYFLWKNRHVYNFSNPIFKTLVPFFFVAFVSLVYAINLPIGIQKTISYSLFYGIIPISVYNIYKVQGREFFEVLIAYFFLMLLIGLLLYFIAPQITQLMGERYKGLFGNPNGLGIFIVQIILLFSILKETKLISFSRREYLFFIGVLFISLILSGSRNSMISILLFLFLIRVFRIHFLLGVLVLFATFYFFQLFTFDPAAIIESVGLEDYFRIETIESGSGRFIAWDFAWQKIQNSFFIGGGFGQDEQIMRPNYEMLKRLGHSGGVHNSYLSMWMDTGLVGLILYFGAMITLIWRASKNSPLAWPFFFTILFNITYESWLVGSLNPFTILFLCSLTLLVMKPSFMNNDELLTQKSDSTE
jgi:O-antigen ligase